MSDAPSHELVEVLESCRERERAQTRFYRSLAAEAELRDEPGVAERLNALPADEQHHLSRLTVRLLEFGVRPRELPPGADDNPGLEGWEARARARESGEAIWYQDLLDGEVDAGARRLLEDILESENRHRDELGGKWMPA